MQIRTNNIKIVVEQHLCNSCGACVAVCPEDAVEFKETITGNLVPYVRSDICSDCGLCLKVCPGLRFCGTLLKKTVQDSFEGRALKAFLGIAGEKEIYNNAQSGGVVSAIALFLLKTSSVKGIVVASMEKGLPPRPVVKIATNEREIIASQKSKYCPVPLLSFLKKMHNEKQPIAIVGLPCHIHGLYNILDYYPHFRNAVKYKIGLICGGVMGYSAMDYLCATTRTLPDSEWLLIYRDKLAGGYPGNIRIIDAVNSYTINKRHRMAVKEFFTPARCRICFDKMNIFSDITVGDPWGIEAGVHKNGSSVCVARNALGLDLIKRAKADKSIVLEEISYKSVLAGQKIDRKKEEWQGYVEAWFSKCRELPNYCSALNSRHANKAKTGKYVNRLEFLERLESLASKDLLNRHIDRKLHKKSSLKYFSSLASKTRDLIKKVLRKA